MQEYQDQVLKRRIRKSQEECYDCGPLR